MNRLQSALRWCFLHAEALFSRAFGERLNPLYHIGSITFFLFFVVAGTGLYLYAFFDTGVGDAYASVQALTQRQWFAGGVMRSVHRYASDAMVLTMLAHLLRHFAFDHLRGFRWFSWVSGIVLMLLVYVAGFNGYMLPWDRLAQFVVVASFEWLDWLPIFSGALMRNFIYAASVGDRLFSLLVFIHIGLPLLVLLLMWIHVQRVPKAAMHPPRALALGVTATLLVLALLRPVASQGGEADLGSAPQMLALDWFYLGPFPLLYRWPLGVLWGALAAATALLLALPWLPPRRRADVRMTVHPGARHVAVRGGETLLDAGLRAGLALPYQCRSGGCGECLCTVLNGRVDLGAYQPAALPEGMRELGLALMCCAVPLGDVEIEVQAPSLDAGAAPVRRYDATVVAMERLADDVMRLTLALPKGERIEFAAGQYIEVLCDDGRRRAFSFANPPRRDGTIELHVRRIPGGHFTGQVFTTMKVGDKLSFEAPLGRFVLRESDRPIVFVAGATGFAPVKSLVEDAFDRGLRRPMRLYWGVRSAKDLYLRDLPERWQREHANFTFVPVLSQPDPSDGWTGRTGLVHEAMLEDFADLAGCEVYVCGSVRMVESALPALIGRGVAEDACFSDAFAGAPIAASQAQDTSA
jgi:NAD(P)H-flavin reductase/ferredoxin